MSSPGMGGLVAGSSRRAGWLVLGAAALVLSSTVAFAKDNGRSSGAGRERYVDASARHASRDRCDTPTHRSHASRRDSYGWYGSTHRGVSSCGTTVSVHTSFGPVIVHDRFGRQCSSYSGYGYRSYGPYYRYRTYYGSEPWYSGPSTRYRLVYVDPDVAATRVSAAEVAALSRSGSEYHQWQAQVRAQAALTGVQSAAPVVGNESAPAVAARPGPASVSKSPTAAQKGAAESQVKPDPPRVEPLSADEVKQAWSALEEGRFLEAHALFARGADVPAMPGSADQRAAFSVGYAVAASMLNREEAAAWALRRAADLDASFATRPPWTEALKQRVREAAGRAGELHRSQPTPDRATLVRLLGALVE
ncbi:MAG: hypothetical protein ACKVZJ_02485 [Phycisphaerales bacterium]